MEKLVKSQMFAFFFYFFCFLFSPSNGLQAAISEERFDQLIDDLISEFSTDISEKGGVLKVDRKWTSQLQTEKAIRNKHQYIIEVHGGLARHPDITEDGFLLILCHELGHLIGSYPYFKEPHLSVLSNEGQADYFATNICLKRLWKNDQTTSSLSVSGALPLSEFNQWFDKECQQNFAQDPQEKKMCPRLMQASLNASIVLGKVTAQMLGKPYVAPEVGLIDKRVVADIRDRHSNPQCRLETFIRGILKQPRPACWYTEKKEEKALLYAVGAEQVGLHCIKDLLQAGASPHTMNQASLSVLSLASKKGDSDLINLLLDYQADPLMVDEHFETPLHFATRSGKLQAVRSLLGRSTSMAKKLINFPNQFGQTPLHLAVINGNLSIVQYLVHLGGDLNARNTRNETPLMVAQKLRHDDIAHFLQNDAQSALGDGFNFDPSEQLVSLKWQQSTGIQNESKQCSEVLKLKGL